MPVYQVRIKKQHSTKLITWENRYYLEGATLADTHNEALDKVVAAEQSIHQSVVNIIECITSDLPVGGSFIASNLSAACSNGVSGDELPGILTLNCVFNKTGFGRPDRKYYHVFWGETGQAGGVWGTSQADAVTGVLNTLITDLLGVDVLLCDRDGSNYLTALALYPVGHHKFSKRSKRAVAGP